MYLINKFVKYRQSLAKFYDINFSDTKYFLKQKIKKKNKSSYNLYHLLIDFKKTTSFFNSLI